MGFMCFLMRRNGLSFDQRNDFLIGYGEQRLKYLTGRVFTELP